MDDIQLHEFNIQNFAQYCSIVVIGPPGSGKSTFIENVAFYNKHKYPTARVICSLLQCHDKYCKNFPSLFVHKNFNKEDEQEYINKRQKKLFTINPDKNLSNLYIMDDIELGKNGFHDDFFKDLFKRGSRWYNQMTIIGNQYPMDFPPQVRDCVSYVVIFKFPNKSVRQKIFTNFGGVFGSFETFNKIMDDYAKDYTCLIINNTNQLSNSITECVFWYRTEVIEKEWTFGCNEYIKWGQVRGDPTK